MEAHGAVGTPTFMAPEQARGNPEEMDERSDIFGLGAILYEIVSGKMPYGPSLNADYVLARAVEGKVISIDDATTGIGVSRRIRSIVAKAVAVKPEDRYQTVVELQHDVRAFLQGGLHLPRRSFAPGSLIIREGDVGEEAYMIVSGTCRALRARDGQQETINTMTAGDVFGEMALLLAEPRAATVEAVDQVTVLVLDQGTMTAGLGFDGWTGALVRALAHRFRALEQQVRDSGIRRG